LRYLCQPANFPVFLSSAAFSTFCCARNHQHTKRQPADNLSTTILSTFYLDIQSYRLIDQIPEDFQTQKKEIMPSSNGGRGGYKNKKDSNSKDPAMIENVREKFTVISPFLIFRRPQKCMREYEFWSGREI
jgi:hypothetical protein